MFVSSGEVVTKSAGLYLGSAANNLFPRLSNMPGMAGAGWPSAYNAIYQRQLWPFVVINKLAKAAARLPLPVYQRNANNGRVRVPEHPMAKLLGNPNPGMSGYDLWLWTSTTFDIHGEAFWYKERQRGQVINLFPFHPTCMSLDNGRWTFDNGSQVVRDIDPDDLVIFKTYNPSSLTRGLSPLEPLRATLENEWSARSATSSFWERGARPGMALTHPGNISEGAIQRLQAQMADKAGAGKTGSTLVLEEGMEPKPMTLTYEEAQYIETRKLNREEVCAGYDIPPPVVHILDHATFSNITEQMRSMYRDTMPPRLRHFESTIELELRSVEWPGDDIYAEFLLDEVLRGDFEARQDALRKAEYMTLAEKRAIENLPHLPDTDRIFLNTATMPLDKLDAQVDAQITRLTDLSAYTPPHSPPSAEDAPEDPYKSAAGRKVLGRLSWQKSLADVQPFKIIEDIDLDHAAVVLRAIHDELEADGTVQGLRDRLKGLR